MGGSSRRCKHCCCRSIARMWRGKLECSSPIHGQLVQPQRELAMMTSCPMGALEIKLFQKQYLLLFRPFQVSRSRRQHQRCRRRHRLSIPGVSGILNWRTCFLLVSLSILAMTRLCTPGQGLTRARCFECNLGRSSRELSEPLMARKDGMNPGSLSCTALIFHFSCPFG